MRCLLALTLLLSPLPASAAEDILIDLHAGRQEGIFFKSPVRQRAILIPPDKKSQTALLFFRGWPGIARIESIKDKTRNLIPFLGQREQQFKDAGIALVIVDCPTDEWGQPGPNPTACSDEYRSSGRHLADVRLILKELKEKFGYTRFFVLGHSYGTISSKWLALGLGSEIAGSIHSAAMTSPAGEGDRYGCSVLDFPLADIKTPTLHIHHQDDACYVTPYRMVRNYATDNLVTVRGGTPGGNPCRGHFHSYDGRATEVATAIIDWIIDGRISPLVGAANKATPDGSIPADGGPAR